MDRIELSREHRCIVHMHKSFGNWVDCNFFDLSDLGIDLPTSRYSASQINLAAGLINTTIRLLCLGYKGCVRANKHQRTRRLAKFRRLIQIQEEVTISAKSAGHIVNLRAMYT